jgi:hypothetical protein
MFPDLLQRRASKAHQSSQQTPAGAAGGHMQNRMSCVDLVCVDVRLSGCRITSRSHTTSSLKVSKRHPGDWASTAARERNTVTKFAMDTVAR